MRRIDPGVANDETVYGTLSPREARLPSCPISGFHGLYVARVGRDWCCPNPGTGHQSAEDAAEHAASIMLAIFHTRQWEEANAGS